MLKITPTKMIHLLLPIYKSGKKVPTVMLWGQPGVGKSEGVHRLAEKLENETGKKVHVKDVRLLLYNPIDLRGIPVPDERKENAKWLSPEVFKFDSSPQTINILLLDELSAAPPSVQAAAYQLILDRKIGEHVLPDNVIVIGAGNRQQDRGVAYKMPTPLANRMSHFEVVSEIEDWKDWAIETKVHPMIIGFLNFKPTYLNKFDAKNDATAFATPRTWSFVDDYLNIFEDQIEAAFPMIVSTVGEGVAIEFKAFCKTYHSLPSFEDIAQGKEVKLKNTNPDVICALSSMIVGRAENISKDELRNVFHFLLQCNLPSEFMVMTVKDLFRVKGVMEKLREFNRFSEWYMNNIKFLK
jgi:hypothetical protein